MYSSKDFILDEFWFQNKAKGKQKGVQNSAGYKTFIETYKQVRGSFWDYYCKLLGDIKGRTYYENHLPMTIYQ